MLLPHANLVVPNKQAIRNLEDIIQLYEKLRPEPFNYGSGSKYQNGKAQFDRRAAKPLPQLDNPVFGLPLFEKR